MRLMKLFAVIVLVLSVSGIALANPIDTQLNVNGGCGNACGTPPLGATQTITADSFGNASMTFQAVNQVLSIVMSMPQADWIAPDVCAASNAFVNQSLVPTLVGGNLVCTYTIGPTDPNESAESEPLFQMQTDCFNTNMGTASEFDDCVGIAAGADVTFTIGHAQAGSVATIQAVTAPEPGSFSLLFAGFFGLAFMRRKLGR
jgi:hypothetical protein